MPLPQQQQQHHLHSDEEEESRRTQKVPCVPKPIKHLPPTLPREQSLPAQPPPQAHALGLTSWLSFPPLIVLLSSASHRKNYGL